MKPRTLALSTLLLATPAAHAAVVLSEFRPNPPGTDPGTQDVELSGMPGEAYSGFISSIESDGFNGTIDRQTPVSGTLDGNGLAVINIPDLENPSFTVIFSELDGGGIGADLDADNDGLIDAPASLGTVYDALSVPDAVGDQGFYAGQLGGVDLTFIGAEPELVFRDGTTGDWYAVNFFGDVFDAMGTDVLATGTFAPDDPAAPTFGETNPSLAPIPEPASAMLLALGALAMMRRRR